MLVKGALVTTANGSDTKEVLFNSGQAPVFRVPKPTTPHLARHANELVSLSVAARRGIDNRGSNKPGMVAAAQIASARQVCMAHGRGEILLSPYAFTNAYSGRVAAIVTDQLLERLPLGRSLVADLGRGWPLLLHREDETSQRVEIAIEI